jgi:hypothetical protein
MNGQLRIVNSILKMTLSAVLACSLFPVTTALAEAEETVSIASDQAKQSALATAQEENTELVAAPVAELVTASVAVSEAALTAAPEEAEAASEEGVASTTEPEVGTESTTTAMPAKPTMPAKPAAPAPAMPAAPTSSTYILTFDKNAADATPGTISSKPVSYGKPVGPLPLMKPEAPSRPGYIFMGWSVEHGPSNMTDLTALTRYIWEEDKTAYAVWAARDGIPYTVDHYWVDASGTAVLHESDTPQPMSVTGYTVSAMPKAYGSHTYQPGYRNGSDVEIASGTVAGDGSLVLKLYYTENKNNGEDERANEGEEDLTPAEVPSEPPAGPPSWPPAGPPSGPPAEPPAGPPSELPSEPSAEPAEPSVPPATPILPTSPFPPKGETFDPSSPARAYRPASSGSGYPVGHLVEGQDSGQASTVGSQADETSVTLADSSVPLDEPSVALDDGDAPLSDLVTTTGVSLLNLILAILSALVAMVLALYNIADRRAPHRRTVFVTAAIAALLGLATTVVWVILDGLKKPTVWTDTYTPIIVTLFVLAATATVLHLILRRRLANSTDDTDAQDPTMTSF